MTTTGVRADETFELAARAADNLRDGLGVHEHQVVVTLGSGWAPAADSLGEIVGEMPLSDVAGFPAPQVPGHADLARSLLVGDAAVLVLGGRVHLYEGFGAAQVVHGVRAAWAAGCSQAIMTNAAGAIRSDLAVGSPVLIADQLNLTGTSPMAGPTPPDHLPGRFCDMTNAYSPRLQAIARQIDPKLGQGVYAGMFGGAYETPAEVQMLAALGADMVGMSTVLETIAARHLGMEVLGLSLITNMAAGVTGEALAHSDVLETAAAATETIVHLIGEVIRRS